VKIRAANSQSASKDAKFQAEIAEHLRNFRVIRKELRRSQLEIKRLKASSRRKLAEIDEILSKC